jgi:hypothetical protein
MSNTDEELLKTANGGEDTATKAVKLIKKPHAFLDHFIEMQKARSVSSPFLLSLAFYLLPQLKLQLPLAAKFLDKKYAEAMFNSSAVNLTYEVLPSRYQERFNDLNPFSGFKQFFVQRDISLLKADRANQLLQKTVKDCSNNQFEVVTFHVALELLLENAPSLNDDLGLLTLSSYKQQPSNKETGGLIVALGDYFARNDYGGVNYQQLTVLAECIAYVKRFHRNLWRVEVEDVLEAWFLINYCRKPRPPLKDEHKRILEVIGSQNRAGLFPTQRKIIKKTDLSNNTVSKAIGLEIQSKEGRGYLIVDGYVEFLDAQKGYQLTELGRLALTNDFQITVSRRTYRPKNPLEW